MGLISQTFKKIKDAIIPTAHAATIDQLTPDEIALIIKIRNGGTLSPEEADRYVDLVTAKAPFPSSLTGVSPSKPTLPFFGIGEFTSGLDPKNFFNRISYWQHPDLKTLDDAREDLRAFNQNTWYNGVNRLYSADARDNPDIVKYPLSKNVFKLDSGPYAGTIYSVGTTTYRGNTGVIDENTGIVSIDLDGIEDKNIATTTPQAQAAINKEVILDLSKQKIIDKPYKGAINKALVFGNVPYANDELVHVTKDDVGNTLQKPYDSVIMFGGSRTPTWPDTLSDLNSPNWPLAGRPLKLINFIKK